MRYEYKYLDTKYCVGRRLVLKRQDKFGFNVFNRFKSKNLKYMIAIFLQGLAY